MDSNVPVMHGRKISKTRIHILFWHLIRVHPLLHLRRKWTYASVYCCVESHVLYPCLRVVVQVRRCCVCRYVKRVRFLLWFVHVHRLFRNLYRRLVWLELFELGFLCGNRVFGVGEVGVGENFLYCGTLMRGHSQNGLDQVDLLRSLR